MSEIQSIFQSRQPAWVNPALVPTGTYIGEYAHGIALIPEAVSGSCEVRDMFDREYGYQGLYRQGQLIDTNDPRTLSRHQRFLRQARGTLLVANAGLGGFLYRLLRKPQVLHITVAEPDFDIIELVEPVFSAYADKVTFVHGSWSDVAKYNNFDDIYLG